MDHTRSAGQPFVGYALRRVAVAPDLDALRGPLHGRWQFPLHLDASSRSVYDFGSPQERELAYRVVLLEAGSHRDHEQWLDRDELLQLWPELYLPRRACRVALRARRSCEDRRWPARTAAVALASSSSRSRPQLAAGCRFALVHLRARLHRRSRHRLCQRRAEAALSLELS